MRKNKRARLEAHGWQVGDATDFLALSPEEAALVETKLALSGSVRDRRSGWRKDCLRLNLPAG